MIYFVSCNDEFIKIGYCCERNLKRRMNALQVGNPQRMTLIKVIEGEKKDERELHDRFAHLRVQGEWFKLNEELRAYLAMAASFPPNLTLAEVERRHILRVLAAVDENKTQAANILGIDRKTLYRKLEEYDLS